MATLLRSLNELLGLGMRGEIAMAERMRHLRTTANIGCVVGTAFAGYNLFVSRQYAIGGVELAAVLLLVLPAVMLSQQTRWVTLGETLVLLATLIIFATLMVFGGVAGTGLLWVFSVPLVTFFLVGQRRGWWYSAGFIVAAVSYFLWVAPALSFAYQYPPAFVLHFVLAYTFYTIIAAAFNQLRSRFEASLQQRVEEKTADAKALLTQLQHQATHDRLTGLPNEVLLGELLNGELLLARQRGYGLAVCTIHLQRFFELSNVLGQAGSQMLVQHITRHLSQVVADTGCLARTGRDEFVLIYRQPASVPSARSIEPFFAGQNISIEMDGYTLYLEFTVGLANYPQHGEDGPTLLHKSEQAMLQARKNGDSWTVYDTQQDQNFVRHHLLFGKLREALLKQQLRVWFQPQVDLRSGRTTGAEALARWTDSSGQNIPPSLFIPVAEESGLIRLLSRWLIDQCLQHMARWQQQGLALELSINLSASNLLDPELLTLLSAGLASSGVAPHHITLEITESCFMNSPDRAMDIIRRIHEYGFKLSIDDFGTGYSSLSYLKKLPMNELKIDQSFVFDLLKNRGDQAIVASTIELAHQLGLVVVAEGIEDKATADWLIGCGCDIGQGYFYAKPMPPEKFLQFVQQPLPISNAA